MALSRLLCENTRDLPVEVQAGDGATLVFETTGHCTRRGRRQGYAGVRVQNPGAAIDQDRAAPHPLESAQLSDETHCESLTKNIRMAAVFHEVTSPIRARGKLRLGLFALKPASAANPLLPCPFFSLRPATRSN
jgi:hypothetical protein